MKRKSTDFRYLYDQCFRQHGTPLERLYAALQVLRQSQQGRMRIPAWVYDKEKLIVARLTALGHRINWVSTDPWVRITSGIPPKPQALTLHADRYCDREHWLVRWRMMRLGAGDATQNGWTRRAKKANLIPVAVDVALEYHTTVKPLFKSQGAVIEYGSGGEVKNWKTYSKRWHNSHGPAKWKNPGVLIRYADNKPVIVLNPVGRKPVNLPMDGDECKLLVARIITRKMNPKRLRSLDPDSEIPF